MSSPSGSSTGGLASSLKDNMRGFSPKLVISKQVHPFFQSGLEEVRNNPRFYEAIRSHADANRIAFGTDNAPYFAKYIGDIGNVLIESAALYFHLLKMHGDVGAGATLGKLQLIAFVHGFASPRRVTMYVKRMVQIGRLSYSAEVADKRVRRLVPSETLIATAVNHLVVLMRSADIIWPGAGFADRTAGDSDFFARLFLYTGKKYVEGADPLRPFADIRHFSSKDAGTFLLNTLVFACLDSKDALLPDTEFSISYSEIAQSAGVSRTHVRNVIEAAEARGLIENRGSGGKSIRFTAKLIDSYERYFACLLLLARWAALEAAKGPYTTTN